MYLLIAFKRRKANSLAALICKCVYVTMAKFVVSFCSFAPVVQAFSADKTASSFAAENYV